MAAKVSVLFNGFSELNESKTVMRANGTSTLVQSQSFNIIVDTMTPWDKDILLKTLFDKHNLAPENITHVICTHGHSDHVGNNNLFTNALLVFGQSVSKGTEYDLTAFKNGKFVINDEVEIFSTPGHTLDSISVKVVSDQGIVVIAGDLFEREEDLVDEKLWKDIAGSEDPKLQKENRENILKVADFIIPGHGPIFTVPRNRNMS